MNYNKKLKLKDLNTRDLRNFISYIIFLKIKQILYIFKINTLFIFTHTQSKNKLKKWTQ